MMTKEELEKEAEEFTDSKKSFWRQGRTCIDSVKQAYLAGAEPREKRIAELEEKLANADYQLEGRDNEIRKLEKENKVLAQNLEDSEIIIAGLKAQIEKMKCCGNCAKNGHICVAEEMQGNLCGKNKDKWELRR